MSAPNTLAATSSMESAIAQQASVVTTASNLVRAASKQKCANRLDMAVISVIDRMLTNPCCLVCGSLAKGRDRQMRSGDTCECDEGWTGINCNVCTDNRACNSMVETGNGGVCYQNGEVVRNNHQICKVTNRKITDLLGEQRPEVTFTCRKDERTCDFQCMPSIYFLLECNIFGN